MCWWAQKNNNNNTNICKAHIVSIRAESEAPNCFESLVRWSKGKAGVIDLKALEAESRLALGRPN